MAYIQEPNIPKILDKVITFAETKLGAKMMPARLLLWAPKAFVSSMILEGLITHKQGRVSPRMLKLIRMQVSLKIACPFCIDMNSKAFRDYGVTEQEIKAMQGLVRIADVDSFSSREKLVLYYAKGIVRTPIKVNPDLIDHMTRAFNEKEFAAIVTTVGQVDYWTRIIQGFGIQPAGFLEACDLDIMIK